MKFFTVVAVLAVITSAVLAATTSSKYCSWPCPQEFYSFNSFVYLEPASAAEETACQSHRKREMASSTRLPGRVIPECDANGNYMPKQCFSDVTTRKARWCGCWNANGDIITNPSTKTEECKCVIERDQKTKSKGKQLARCLLTVLNRPLPSRWCTCLRDFRKVQEDPVQWRVLQVCRSDHRKCREAEPDQRAGHRSMPMSEKSLDNQYLRCFCLPSCC